MVIDASEAGVTKTRADVTVPCDQPHTKPLVVDERCGFTHLAEGRIRIL
jgi:hypothetical protein